MTIQEFITATNNYKDPYFCHRPRVFCKECETDESTQTVYPCVSIEIIDMIIRKHGGIDTEKTFAEVSDLQEMSKEETASGYASWIDEYLNK